MKAQAIKRDTRGLDNEDYSDKAIIIAYLIH